MKNSAHIPIQTTEKIYIKKKGLFNCCLNTYAAYRIDNHGVTKETPLVAPQTPESHMILYAKTFTRTFI